MNNTRARRHNFKVLESILAPAQKLITLKVAFVFNFNVLFEGGFLPEYIDNHRVVNDQFNRCQRVNFGRVAA